MDYTWPTFDIEQDTNFQAQQYCHYFGVDADGVQSGARFGFTANENAASNCDSNDTAIGLFDDGAFSGAGFDCGYSCYQGGSAANMAEPNADVAMPGLLWVK